MAGPLDRGPIITPGRLTPTPRRQATFVGAALGLAAVGALPAGLQVRLLTRTTHLYAGLVAMGDAYPALGSSQKLGIRYGGTGEVTTLGRAIPITNMYGPLPSKVPFPDFGFGLTAVPITSSRWVYENNKSRGGEHTSQSSGTPVAEPSISGLSAKSPVGTRAKRGKGDAAVSTRGARGRTRPKTVRYRKGGCPPGYRYDPRKKMCVRTSK